MTGPAFTGEWRDTNALQYHRARYYAPSLGIFPSLDPWEGLFDRPMSLNGYAWVEGNPINLTDASGMCPENPHPWDLFGRRCQALAYGLAARTGISVDTFMTLNYIQLEGLTALRTMGDIGMELERLMNNATVLPRLFREDPQRALQALEMVACQNEGTLMGGMALAALIPMSGLAQAGALGAGVTATGGSSAIGGGLTATGIGAAIGGGVLLGVGAVLLWEHLTMSTGAIALPMPQTYHFSDSRAQDDAEAVPIPWPTDFDTCSNKWQDCSVLEDAGGRYWNYDDALESMIDRYNDNSIEERKSEREFTDSGHCSGFGSHSQFYDKHRTYKGSITCCPCCDYGIPDVRCFIRWPH